MNALMRWILFLPPQASTFAMEVDWLHYFVITATMLGATGVAGLAGWFVIRYRASREQEPPRVDGNTQLPKYLELGFIVGLFALFIGSWWVGMRIYTKMRVAPEGSMKIYVTGKQWMWKFAYPEGAHSIAKLYVPVARPIELVMTSRDVVHSFYVPEFRIKQDVVPGRYTTVWFEVVKPGTYQIFCAEYCGLDHSTMRAEVVAMEPGDYARWLHGPTGVPRPQPSPYDPPANMVDEGTKEPLSLVRQGEIAAARHGCQKCHTIDGSPHIGPTWAGLYMSNVPLADGTTVVADDAYLTESMMDPTAKIHAGFEPVMPSFLGQMEPAEVGAIVEFIRALRAGGPPPLAAQEEPPPALPQNRERVHQEHLPHVQGGDTEQGLTPWSHGIPLPERVPAP